MTDTADVVVIGGGVQGASLAFHLASRGARVTVVERSTIGAGATGRSSGLVRVLLRPARRGAGRRGRDRVVPRLGGSRRRRLRLHPGRVPVDRGRRRDRSRARQRREPPRARGRQPRRRCRGDPRARAGSRDRRRRGGGLGARVRLRRPVDDRRLVHAGGARPRRAAGPGRGGHGDPASRAAASAASSRRPAAIDAPVVVNAAGRLGGAGSPRWRASTCRSPSGATTPGYLGVPASVPRPIPVVIDIPNEMYFRPEGSELVLIGLEDDNQMGGDPDRETATAAVAFHDAPRNGSCAGCPGSSTGRSGRRTPARTA